MTTDCLNAAAQYASNLFMDEIDAYEDIKTAYEKERKEAEERKAEMHEDYKAWKNGWGKYYQSDK